jgi:hypothetical protein
MNPVDAQLGCYATDMANNEKSKFTFADYLSRKLYLDEFLEAMNDNRLEPWQKSEIADHYFKEQGVKDLTGDPLISPKSNGKSVKPSSCRDDPEVMKIIEKFKACSTKIRPPIS